MPTATRTFRVFVSSTFEDLKAERDALQRGVFPKLRKLCEENNARFQAIDLRWGVRDEAALDQQTLEICLREIERCQQTGIKPNFIVLLGERYGWLPLPARIEAEEFGKICDRVADADKRLVNDWYERDDNAVPPEYLLKPRTGEFADKGRWGEVEQNLHRTLWKAAQDAGLTQASLMKYEASATHQEILKGLGQSEEDRRHLFAFFREPATGATVDPKLEALKDDLRNKLPVGNVQPFRIGEIKKLCTDVEESLKKVILDVASKFTSRDDLDLEIEAHDRFAKDRCRIFVGRRDALNAISDYLSGPERRPLVLHGESGIGKSAVMAVASQHYKAQVRLIRRFIGASPESASGHTLLTSLCKQIAPGETPVDYYKLEKAFQERLAGVTVEQPLVLFIDALDQLGGSDPARTANWLPPELPPHVKVIVSTTENEGRLSNGLQVRLERMTTAEGAQALDALLREARRTLQTRQRDAVLAHFERCGLPLYLKLAAEESRLWKSFSPPDSCKLGEGIAGVLDTLFDRLASNANHGPVLVERSLGYLATARYGLTENEILDVLTADDVVWTDFDKRKHHDVGERRLPVVVWSRLSLDLEPYLKERAAPGGTVIAFYHRQLVERVAGRFLAGDETKARHGDLARYFSASPAWLDEGRKTPNARRAAELAFHQRGAKQWDEAEATLFDCPFLFAKVAAGMVLELEDDYQALLRNAPESELPRRDTLQLIQGALRLSMHVLTKDASQLASQLIGRLLPHEKHTSIRQFTTSVAQAAIRPWLRPLRPALDPPGTALLRTLAGHSAKVNAVAVTLDGRRAVSASSDKTLKLWDLETGGDLRTLAGHSSQVFAVAVTPDGRCAVSASEDTTLKVWDLETGVEQRTLAGHSDWVNGVAVTPDGRRAVSASDDNTLKVWDHETGSELRTLAGHSGSVNGVAVTPDGRRVISASDDDTLKVWDLETGDELRTLEGHSGGVNGVAVTPDGRRVVSASWNATLKVWDLETGNELCTLSGHSNQVLAVAVTPDGHRAVSAGLDMTLKIWNIETGVELLTRAGHTNRVSGVVVMPDGRHGISASWDHTLKVWDLEPGDELCSVSGHSDMVLSVAVTPDGRRGISTSNDKTLKVWDLETGGELHTLRGHSGGVNDVEVTQDGLRAVSASGDKTLRVWDLETGGELHTLRGHSGRVNDVEVIQDGLRAVSASDDKTLRVWDLETGDHLRTFLGHLGWVRAVTVTPDARFVVSASKDKTLKVWDLWDLESKFNLRSLAGHSDQVLAVALTPDGLRAVSASWDQTLKVWDLSTGCELCTLTGHTDMVYGVVVMPDGRRAISASLDNMLKVWDLETGIAVRTLAGHTDAVLAVALSVDAKRAASGSCDHTLRIWDVETGRCLTVFSCDAEVSSCAWAREWIVAGDASGRVHLFVWEE